MALNDANMSKNRVLKPSNEAPEISSGMSPVTSPVKSPGMFPGISTEGLQSQNQELQSLNQELKRRNSQLNDKIRSLEKINDDLSKLLASKEIAGSRNLVADLRAEAARLAEANRRKDEFLSMLGHELRNPLAPIRNALSTVAWVGDEKACIEWAHGLIDRQVGHLERLVDDLVDTARINRGTIALKTETLDLRCSVHDAVEAARCKVAERAHRLDVDLPQAPVPVVGDSTRLVQVMANLIDNAVKYTDEGGTIRVSLTHDDTKARLTVTDNGSGIPSEDLPHLFEAYCQGGHSIHRANSGLGLGLPLVRQLVQLHGGTVEAGSAGLGQGSRFVVYLPLSTRPIREPAGCKEFVEPTRQKRIILADDNPDVLASLKLLLRVLGHEVWDLPAGEAVADIAEQVQPHLVILDIGLPGIDGVEVARRLAKLPHRRAMKVVALSGYVEGSVDPELFDAHLLKGASTDELMRFLD